MAKLFVLIMNFAKNRKKIKYFQSRLKMSLLVNGNPLMFLIFFIVG